MRFLARWSVVLALCAAVAVAAARPALGHCTSPGAPAAASSDAAVTSSGFTSTPAPERTAYIGPGVVISGSTVLGTIVPSPSFVAWRLPSRATAESSPALHASHLAPHLRSIPLLI